jgi:hypothetical protein
MQVSPLPHPSHPPRIYHLNMSGEEYKLWISSLRNFLQPSVTLSLVSWNILCSILLSYTLDTCSSLSVHQQVNTHTKPQIKLQLLNDLISRSLHCKQGDTRFGSEWTQTPLEFICYKYFCESTFGFFRWHTPIVLFNYRYFFLIKTAEHNIHSRIK